MRSPNLVFDKEKDLVWESFVDDVCFMTEEIEDYIRNFANKFKQKFPESILEVHEIKLDKWESEHRGADHSITITDFNVVLKFNSNEDEAEFIMLKSAGQL